MNILAHGFLLNGFRKLGKPPIHPRVTLSGTLGNLTDKTMIATTITTTKTTTNPLRPAFGNIIVIRSTRNLEDSSNQQLQLAAITTLRFVN